MKFLFCIFVIIIQPAFLFMVYRRQDKRQAALKMPMIYVSVAYLVIQMTVFFKICLKLPGKLQMLAYLIQAGILFAFLVAEALLFFSNKYINRIQTQEKEAIVDFKNLISELEIVRVGVGDEKNRKEIDGIYDAMRTSDPVSSPEVADVNKKIGILIQELSEISEQEAFRRKCSEISKALEIRKIKNRKVQG